MQQPIEHNDGRCVQMPGTQSGRPDEPSLLGIPRSGKIIAITYPRHDMVCKDYRSRFQGGTVKARFVAR